MAGQKTDQRDAYIGQRIAEERRRASLTQRRVAQSFGMSAAQLQKYEKGTNRISALHLEILARMVPRLGIRAARMLEAASDPAIMATEVADYLVLKGVPFRRAHDVVGQAVRSARDKKVSLAELSLDTWQALDPAFDAGVSELFDPRRAIARRRTIGTPGPRPVKRALTRALLAVKRNRQWLTETNPGY